MTKKVDHVFLFTLHNQQIGIAFCSASLNVQQGREEIEKVFNEDKKITILNLNYLGCLNYIHMDQGIMDQLYVFEKYNPVWLWMPVN